MSILLRNSRNGSSRSQRDKISLPLRNMRNSEQAPLNEEDRKEEDEDGLDDFDPLLASAEGTLERVKAEIEYELGTTGADSTYDRKSIIINKAIQDIGLGRYQWQLFSLCGMGWLADNLWMTGLALVLPQLTPEFGVSVSHIRYTTMITFIGLSLGSTFWGVASDIMGRKPAFNITLFLCGIFGTLVAFGPNWITTSVLFACMGLGVGGNLPVDGALFLEFLPFESNKLLTLLSVWWPVGQLIASLLAWFIIPSSSCNIELQPCSLSSVQPCCESSDNRGWRYYIASLGAITLFMFVCRFFMFHLYESPKFLLSRNRQAEAVAVVQGVARFNGTVTWLSEDLLNEFGDDVDDGMPKLSALEINKRNLSKFSFDKVGALFAEKSLGITTVLLWFMWASIGLGFPLFNSFLLQWLEHAGQQGSVAVSADLAYRNFLITSVAAVPGSLIAAYTVDIKGLGRKGTMAISTLISGVFLYLFTLSDDPGYQTICSSIEAFFQNVMYGVLYSYTPEVFPAPCRGTGTGIASLLNRLAGIAAPAVAAQIGGSPHVPIIAAGACYLAASVAMILLPIETRGKQSL